LAEARRSPMIKIVAVVERDTPGILHGRPAADRRQFIQRPNRNFDAEMVQEVGRHVAPTQSRSFVAFH
jgi:hypothetical protein